MTTMKDSPVPGTHTIELGGIAEVADEFGVPRTTASMWLTRRDANGFPAPIETLSMGPVFDMDKVRTWHAGRYGVKS